MRIIAEVGVNHDSMLPVAMVLALRSRQAGADAVKFQAWFHDKWDNLNHLRFTKDEWKVLFDYCGDHGIPWFCTPFDLEAIEFLHKVGMTTWKIPSGMVTNTTYLEAVRVAAYSQGKEAEIILSSGCCTIEEVRQAKVQFPYVGEKTPRITPIHCVSLYPADLSDMNLGVFELYPGLFRGVSDHTTAFEVAIIAQALGLDYYEKHVTLNPMADGPDHASSLSTWDFMQLVQLVRRIEGGMGYAKPSYRERGIRDNIRNRMAMAC